MHASTYSLMLCLCGKQDLQLRRFRSQLAQQWSCPQLELLPPGILEETWQTRTVQAPESLWFSLKNTPVRRYKLDNLILDDCSLYIKLLDFEGNLETRIFLGSAPAMQTRIPADIDDLQKEILNLSLRIGTIGTLELIELRCDTYQNQSGLPLKAYTVERKQRIKKLTK